MAAELVNSATSDKLAEIDWSKNIEICELVAQDQRISKDVIKAIKKRLESKNAIRQLYAVMLLEMLMNNIGDHIYKLVIEYKILPILTKIVKKKTDFPVREKIFLLLDATQTSLGGASGKFPEYYSAYFDLVGAGVQFPQRPQSVPSDHTPVKRDMSNSSDLRNSQANKSVSSDRDLRSAIYNGHAHQQDTSVPESSIIQKATNALEVLKEVLDAVEAQNPEAAKDEFTLDLVEQCSFQKQRVMHLVITSRNEAVVSQAIELNEKLQKVLGRHDSLLSNRSGTIRNFLHIDEDEEEEEAEQLYRRKGKACARPEDEQPSQKPHMGLISSASGERLNRPLIRPVCTEPMQNSNLHPPVGAIPPPPAKHVEREKYFMENRLDGSGATAHLRSLSLHSRDASSSHSDSLDFSD